MTIYRIERYLNPGSTKTAVQLIKADDVCIESHSEGAAIAFVKQISVRPRRFQVVAVFPYNSVKQVTPHEEMQPTFLRGDWA